jgi:hypothetical protein
MGKAELQDVKWRVFWGASGVRTVGMRSKDFMGTREIRLVQAELVGSDKLAMRGRSDNHSEVRLVDSTLRSGEPVTWGSDQQVVNRSKET